MLKEYKKGLYEITREEFKEKFGDCKVINDTEFLEPDEHIVISLYQFKNQDAVYLMFEYTSEELVYDDEEEEVDGCESDLYGETYIDRWGEIFEADGYFYAHGIAFAYQYYKELFPIMMELKKHHKDPYIIIKGEMLEEDLTDV